MVGYHRIRGIHRLVHEGSEEAEIGLGFDHDLGIGIETGKSSGKMVELGAAAVERVEVGETVFAAVPRNVSQTLGTASPQARLVHSAHENGFENKNESGSGYDRGRSHSHHSHC